MRRSRSRWLVMASALLLIACADDPQVLSGSPGPWSPADGIPTQVELVCGADGSMSLSSETVQAQPDGVHLDVVNQFDETVSVEGFDANPGRSTWVFINGPGTMRLTCRPFSQHTSGQEPPRVSLQIVDPQELYFDGSVGCEPEPSTTGDYAEEPVDHGPPPMEVAREVIDGLRPDDVLRLAGYPEQDRAGYVVIREGEVVAAYGIVRFAGRPWTIWSGTACVGTDLPLAGERMG